MGVLIAKLSEETYEAELEFPGDEGVQNKKPSTGGIRIFSGTTAVVTIREMHTK